MAGTDDLNRIKASYETTLAQSKKLLAGIEENIALAKSVGDEIELSRLEARKAAIKGPTLSGGQTTTQVTETTAAIQRQNVARQAGADIDLKMLGTIKAQNTAYLEQLAIEERLKAAGSARASGLIVPPPSYTNTPAQTAGQQLAQGEREAAIAAQLAQQRAAAEALRSSLIVPPSFGGGGFSSREATAGGLSAQEQAGAASRARLLEAEAPITRELERQNQLIAEQRAEYQAVLTQLEREAVVQAHLRDAFAVGQGVGRGAVLPTSAREAIIQGPGQLPGGGGLTGVEQNANRQKLAMGEYQTLTRNAGLQTNALSGDLTRLGLVQNQASDAMRKHGALTTEFLGALARGETTIQEFGYQIGATIGKFAGWTAAATATYGALGAIVELGKGAIDSANGVGMLHRTIDNLDTQKAAQNIRDLSAGTATPIKEAADAVFQYSRTFHNLADATGAAKLGLSALQLDQVKIADSVKLDTILNQQYGLGIQGLRGVYDLLASGQREYNARLSDMIPFLQKSIGAVKNAGGDLTQLIQLGTYATKVTQLSGTQTGTAFYRAAATFVPKAADQATLQSLGLLTGPNKVQSEADQKRLQSLGIKTSGGNFTQLLMDAIQKALTFDPKERSEALKAIYGPQYGGRFAAVIAPGNVPLLNQITGKAGDPAKALTPAAVKGSLQVELEHLLGTTGKQLAQFVYGLQRLGSALSSSGALQPLGALLAAANVALTGIKDLVEAFDKLPKPMKDVLEVLAAWRVASIVLTGTKLGASVAGLPGLRGVTGVIPGLRQSPEQALRLDVAEGLRKRIADLGNTSAQIGSELTKNKGIQERLIPIQAEQLAATKRGGISQREQLVATEQYNTTTQRLAKLKQEALDNEAALAAIEARRVTIAADLVGTTASKRNPRRYADPQVAGLISVAGTNAAITAAEVEAGDARLGAVAQQKLAIVKARAAAMLGLNAEASLEASLAMKAEALAAAQAGAAANTTVLASARNSLSAMSSRIGAFVGGISPLTALLFGLPLAFEAIKSVIDSFNSATDAATRAATEVPTNLAAVQKKAADLQKAAQKQANLEYHSNVPIFGGLIDTVVNAPAKLIGLEGDSKGTANKSAVQLDAARVYQSFITQAQNDAKVFGTSQQGRDRMYAQFANLRQLGERYAKFSGSGKQDLEAFFNALQTAYQGYQDQLKLIPVGGKKDPFSQFEGQDAKQTKAQLQGLDDVSKVYGTQDPAALKSAIYGYTYLATKYRGSQTPADLQELASAQQNLVSVVTKGVQDHLKAATAATTFSGQASEIHAGLALITTAKATAQKAYDDDVKKWGSLANVTKKAHEALVQITALFDDQLKSVISADIALIKTQSDLATSQIGGISPESDVARAESALQGLRNQLAKAQADGADYQVIAGLTQQINSAAQGLIKQKISNASALLDAQLAGKISSITGIGPADDIARAQQAVSNAQTKLAHDKSIGAGATALQLDQNAIDDASRALTQANTTQMQALHQSAAALIQAQAGYDESLTNDPLKQDRIQLAADIKALAIIKRGDYKSDQDYQAAILNAKKTVNSDKTKINDQIISTDLSNLAFEAHVGKLSDQAYIDGLRKILKTKKLTLQQRQQIETQIYDLTTQLAQGTGKGNQLDLNVGNIKLPTAYQIRAAIARGQRGEIPGSQNTTINHTSTVTVIVNDKNAVSKVGAEIDAHLGTSVKSAMRAAGVI